MNCYACLVETGYDDQPAHAICKQCGAGICRTHLVDVTQNPPTGTIGINAGPRSRVLCLRCYRAIFPSSSSPRAKGYSKSRKADNQRWWDRLWHRQQSTTLPDAQDAVAAVEQFLKQRSTTKKHNNIQWPD
jgi:hypothetical protein